jgi:hypothetical protein
LDPIDVYRHLLPSTVLIATPDGFGSGVLVYRGPNLLVTNDHVIEKFKNVNVFFPEMKGESPFNQTRHYTDNASRLAVRGTVVYRDSDRDLALVEIPSAPADAHPLPLAADSSQPFEEVYSIGGSGVLDGTLWRGSTHKVRGVTEHGLRGRRPIFILETQGATNRGDSGGPVVNNRLQLVAVVQGMKNQNVTGERLIDFNVDVREVRGVLERGLTTAFKQFYVSVGPVPFGHKAATDRSAMTAQPPAHWVAVLRTGSDAQTAEASEALRQHGGTAIAELEKAFADGDRALRLRVIRVVEQIGPPAGGFLPVLVGCLDDNSRAVRVAALRAIPTLGPDARSARARVFRATSDADPDVQKAADDALARLGPIAAGDLPMVISCLRDPDSAIRLRAVRELNRLEPGPDVVVKELSAFLKDPLPEVRKVAVLALGKLGPAARPRLAPLLLTCAAESEAEVTSAAVGVLTEMDPPSIAELSDLRNSLRCDKAVVRAYAVTAIGKLGRDASAAIPELAELLDAPESAVRRAAAAGLLGLAGDYRPIALKIAKLRADNDPGVRVAAAKLTAALPRTSGPVPALLAMMAEQEAGVADAAEAALANLNPALNQQDVTDLTAACDAASPRACALSLRTLRQFGPDAASALPAIQLLLAPRHTAELRGLSAACLRALGPAAAPAAKDMSDALADATVNVDQPSKGSLRRLNDQLSIDLAYALANVGPVAGPAVPALRRMLARRDDAESVKVAIIALGAIGPEAAAATEEMVSVFSMQEKGLHVLAVEAFGKIGKPAVKGLHRRIKDRDTAVRDGCLRSLGAIGPDVNSTEVLKDLMSMAQAARKGTSYHALLKETLDKITTKQ